MGRDGAERLAREFLNVAAPEEATFFTNGAWDQPSRPGGYTSYATDSEVSVDGSIVILHSTGAACLWVEGYD